VAPAKDGEPAGGHRTSEPKEGVFSRLVTRFNRIPLLFRTLLMISVPTTFLVVVCGALLAIAIQEVRVMGEVDSSIAYVTAAFAMVHTLERERGLSALLLSADCSASNECLRTSAERLQDAQGASARAAADFAAVFEALGLAEKTRAKGAGAEGLESAYARLYGTLPDYRLTVLARNRGLGVEPPPAEDAIRFYTGLIAPLVSSIHDYKVERSTSQYPKEADNLADLVLAGERFSRAQALGVSLWRRQGVAAPTAGAGTEVPAALSEFRNCYAAVRSVTALYVSRARPGGARAMVSSLMSSDPVRAAFSLFDIVSAGAYDPGPPISPSPAVSSSAIYDTVQLALALMEAAEAENLRSLQTSNKSDTPARQISLVTLSLLAMVLTCTALVGLFVASVRSSNRILAGALLNARERDAQLRKFVPTKLINLFSVDDPIELDHGMRAARFLTVLFARLEDFPALTANLSPDQMFNRVLEFSSVVDPIIRARGGFVDTWVGPGFYAVFSDAEEAVHAALELNIAVNGLNMRTSVVNATNPAPHRELRGRAGRVDYGGAEEEYGEEEEEDEGEEEEEVGVGDEEEAEDDGADDQDRGGHNDPNDHGNDDSDDEMIPLYGRSTPPNNDNSNNTGDAGLMLVRQSPVRPMLRSTSPGGPSGIHRVPSSVLYAPPGPSPLCVLRAVSDTGSHRLDTTPGRLVPLAVGASSSAPEVPEDQAPTPARRFQFVLGVGVHSGMAVAGIVGDGERADSTVVGDAIDSATRLQSLCQKLGGSLFISEETRKRLNRFTRIEMRSIGMTKLAGRRDPLEVWEVFEGDPEPVKAIKRQNNTVLARASALVRVGGSKEAEEQLMTAYEQSQKTIKDTALEITATTIAGR
jgi:class 3 adenylate cyclase